MAARSDDTVFARAPDGRRVLRTGTSRRWQIDVGGHRRTVPFYQAVSTAAEIRRTPGGLVFPHQPNGSRFYAALDRADLT